MDRMEILSDGETADLGDGPPYLVEFAGLEYLGIGPATVLGSRP